MKKVIYTIFAFVFFNMNAQSDLNPIITATPFLQVAPDARAGGMGDVGVATAYDVNAQFWNPSKYANMEEAMVIGVFHTPWLREVVNDVFLGGLSFASKIDNRSAWALGLRYFNLGNIELTSLSGMPEGTEKINEFSIDGSYALKLSDHYSMGITLRYIRSDLGIESANSDIRAVNVFAADISGFYEFPKKKYGNFDGIWRLGFNISNLGPRVSYTSGKSNQNYLPINMRLGGGFELIFDTQNSLACYLDFNKLLVTTPNVSISGDGKAPYMQSDTGFFEGIFSSFSDAPGGFKEELKEISVGVGLEYLFNKVFAFRTGYFHESESKGTRQFFTLGSGLSYKRTKLDISYLFNTSSIANPLENTLRLSLSFTVGRPQSKEPALK